MKQNLLILFCLVLTACAGNDNSAQNTFNQPAKIEHSSQPKPAEAVTFSTEPLVIKAAGSGEIPITLKIHSPFHVNANPPSEQNLIPTSLEFETKNGLMIEKPVYPAGETKKFGFSEKPLSVYEGEVIIKLPVKAAADAQKGAQTLNGKLKFQPCDDKVCYRPQTKDVSFNVTIE